MVIFPIDEIKRKAFHLLMLIYICAYWVLPRTLVISALALFFVLVTAAELIRLRHDGFNRWLLAVLGGVHRPDEEKKVSAIPWTLAGSLLTMLLFPDRRIVLVSFLYLALGDTAAALVGRNYGKIRFSNGKSLEGSMACMAVCFLAGLVFFSWPVALLGAFCATVLETFPGKLNDNFWMPVASAAVLMMVVK